MAPSSIYDELTRQHPAYKAGYDQGRDVGLRMALDIICAEWARVVDAGIVANLNDPNQVHPHEYAAGRLHQVAAIVGATFRNAPQSTHHQGGTS